MMPAAPAPVACCTHEATVLGWPLPLQIWRFMPTLASATFMVAAVTTKPGMNWTSGT